MRKRKGFTLLELIVVIIIVGILATLGLKQYFEMVERSRGAEAKSVCGNIRTSGAAHRLQYGTLDGGGDAQFTEAKAGIGAPGGDVIPNACAGQASHYFSYAMNVDSDDQITITATRCDTAAQGKQPPGPAGNEVELQVEYDTGTDTWNNTGY